MGSLRLAENVPAFSVYRRSMGIIVDIWQPPRRPGEAKELSALENLSLLRSRTPHSDLFDKDNAVLTVAKWCSDAGWDAEKAFLRHVREKKRRVKHRNFGVGKKLM